MIKIVTTIFAVCYLFAQTFAQIQFINVANEVGINHSYGVGFSGGGVSFCDFNGDGFDDLTIATQDGLPIDFYQNLNGNFQKIQPLISDLSEVKQILWVDYDNDGDKDLYISSINSANKLYNNNGELILTEVTESSGLPLDVFESYGASWADVDRDGWLDLYFTKRALHFSSNRAWLYRNNQDGTFSDISEITGTTDPEKAAFMSVFVDINHDLWPDIYTAHDKTQINSLFRNNGDLTFSDIGHSSNADVEINAMGVAVGDYDNDADLDLYISNTPDGNKLLNNTGYETFIEIADVVGVGFHGIGWGVNFLDADHDGDLDLYASGMSVGTEITSSDFFENIGFGFYDLHQGSFIGDTVKSFANAIGDFNSDGRPDIFVNNTSPFQSHLWENLSQTDDNNYLKVELTGVLSNRDGIGSWITIFCNGKRQVRYTHCGISYLGQNSKAEFFGLGESEIVDSILVEWTTGHQDKIYNIAANQKINIEEGSSTDGQIYVDPTIAPTLTNVENLEMVDEFRISPNPSSGELNIIAEKKNIQSIEILNQNGMIVYKQKIESSLSKIHLDLDLPKGVYFIKIENTFGIFQFKKWIVF